MPIHDISNPGCQKTRHLENDFNLSLELCILVSIIFDGRKIAVQQWQNSFGKSYPLRNDKVKQTIPDIMFSNEICILWAWVIQ